MNGQSRVTGNVNTLSILDNQESLER